MYSQTYNSISNAVSLILCTKHNNLNFEKFIPAVNIMINESSCNTYNVSQLKNIGSNNNNNARFENIMRMEQLQQVGIVSIIF